MIWKSIISSLVMDGHFEHEAKSNEFEMISLEASFAVYGAEKLSNDQIMEHLGQMVNGIAAR